MTNGKSVLLGPQSSPLKAQETIMTTDGPTYMDRSELLHQMVARLDASGVDEALLEELQSLSSDEREELARILFERESNQQNP